MNCSVTLVLCVIYQYFYYSFLLSQKEAHEAKAFKHKGYMLHLFFMPYKFHEIDPTTDTLVIDGSYCYILCSDGATLDVSENIIQVWKKDGGRVIRK